MKIEELNTKYTTKIMYEYLIDPSIMDNIFLDTNEKRKVVYYNYKNTKPETNFIKDISSYFLLKNGHNHNPKKWYIDVIRYRLNRDDKEINSGLCWHCENDQYNNVISLLMYLRIDKDIMNGNISYKDKNGIKKILKLKSGTTIIMDGNVPHKPQNPYGTGIRDLIIVNFEKN